MAKKTATRKVSATEGMEGGNTEQKNWTIMLYLAGDNNLSEHLLTALDGIKSIANNSKIMVLAQFDPFSSIQEARRFMFKGDVAKVEKPLVAFQEAISEETKKSRHANHVESPGSRRTERHALISFKEFLAWAMENQPKGDRTFLILAGHGPIVAKRSFLLDKHPMSYVGLDELRKNLENHFGGTKSKLDFLVIDSCMAGGVEVAYELKDCTDYLMASEGFTPSAGRPFAKYYQALAKLLDANADAEPKQVAAEIWLASLKHHLNYRLANHSFQGAVYDLTTDENGVNKAKALADAISGTNHSLVKALHDGLMNEATRRLFVDLLITSHWEAQSFWHEYYTDLYDFCRILRDKCVAWNRFLDNKTICLALITACEAVMTAISEDGSGAVMKSDYIGPDYQYSYGMFILFPWNDPIDEKEAPYHRGVWEEYTATKFFKDYPGGMSWHDFLQCYIARTRRGRDPRHKARKDDFVNNEFTKLEVIGETTKANADGDCVCPTIKNYPQWQFVETSVDNIPPWIPSDTVFTLFE